MCMLTVIDTDVLFFEVFAGIHWLAILFCFYTLEINRIFCLGKWKKEDKG